MPRKSASARAKAAFRFPVPVEVRRPRFKLSPAIRNIDPVKLARRARVEIEVGTFEGEGCGRTVSAVVRKGKVTALQVTPCAEVVPIRADAALRSLAAAARRKLGIARAPRKFRPMSFAAFQQQADDITVTTITCVQICIWGHCIVCCTLAQGGFWCGRRVIIQS